MRYFQRYDLTNVLAWLQYKKPLSVGGNLGKPKKELHYEFFARTLSEVYKSELEEKGLADYIVLDLTKK